MPQSGELDPLLPRNAPAPEISDYGSRPGVSSSEVNYKDLPPSYSEPQEAETRDHESPSTSTQSALSTIIALFTVVVFFAFVTMLLSPDSSDRIFPLPRPRSPQGIQERVTTILANTPLIDGHNDLAILIRGAYRNHIHTKDFREQFEDGGAPYNVDLPRLKSGLVGGAFWSAFVGCPANASFDFSDQEYSTSVARTLSQIDLILRLQAQYPSNFTAATSSLAIHLSRFHSSRSLISPISIEGLHQVPQSAPLSTLRLFYALGVRAATLTWNCHNAFADAALITSGGDTVIAPYYRGGLTPAGRQVIHEMNRLGMLIDISHTSYWTQKAVLSDNTSLAPVIYSHSSAFALCPHPRNVHDDMLELVKKTKSLVMVNFSPGFISCHPPPDEMTIPEFYERNNTLHQVARHILYIGGRIGYDYVGLGSDFDGMGALTPRGLEGVEKYPDLVKELLVMGVSDKDAGKIVGGNLIRVWKEAEAVSARLKKQEHEGEDEVEGY